MRVASCTQKFKSKFFFNPVAICHQAACLFILVLTSVSKAASLHCSNATYKEGLGGVFMEIDNCSAMNAFQSILYLKTRRPGNLTGDKAVFL